MNNSVSSVAINRVIRLCAPLFFCLLSAFSIPVFAAWYQVEVILFNNLEPDADGELWYENPGLPLRDGSIELIMEKADEMPGESVAPESFDSPDDMNLMPYLALPKEYYQLEGVYNVLRFSREYRPLLHVAWQQPGLDSRNVRAIHLDNTSFEEKTTEEPEAPRPDLAEGEWAPAREGEDGAGGVGPSGPVRDWPVYSPPDKVYDGLIRLRSSRFLHIDVDVAYFPDTPEESGPASPTGEETAGALDQYSADYVRLTESRRIRLNEVHYFDHPVFGVIIQVSRLEMQ